MSNSINVHGSRLETKAAILLALIRKRSYDVDSTVTRPELLDILNNMPGRKKITMRNLDIHLTGKWGKNEQGLINQGLVKSNFKGLYLPKPDTLSKLTALFQVLINAKDKRDGKYSEMGRILDVYLSRAYEACYNSELGNKFLGNGPDFYSDPQPFRIYDERGKIVSEFYPNRKNEGQDKLSLIAGRKYRIEEMNNEGFEINRFFKVKLDMATSDSPDKIPQEDSDWIKKALHFSSETELKEYIQYLRDGSRATQELIQKYEGIEHKFLDLGKVITIDDSLERWEKLSKEKTISERISYVLAVMHIRKIIRTYLCGTSSTKEQRNNPYCFIANLTLSFANSFTIENRVKYIFKEEKDIVNEFFNEFIEFPAQNNWKFHFLYLSGPDLSLRSEGCSEVMNGILQTSLEVRKLLNRVPEAVSSDQVFKNERI